MEKAILKTLAYASIFEYPLKAWEIHKWLIQKKATLKQVERSLKKLEKSKEVSQKNSFYFLAKKSFLVKQRLDRGEYSQKLLSETKLVGQLLKLVPFIKLVGVSGSLAMGNNKKSDDIDLFIITSTQRLWVSRFFISLIIFLLGKRRSRSQNPQKISKKYCINVLLEEDCLYQSNKNIYIAHEVLQMLPLWQKNGVYQTYLSDNDWAFKYLPNWTTGQVSSWGMVVGSKENSLLNFIERICRWLQLRYMGRPLGKERIYQNAVYFLPEDKTDFVLNKYQKKLKQLQIK